MVPEPHQGWMTPEHRAMSTAGCGLKSKTKKEPLHPPHTTHQFPQWGAQDFLSVAKGPAAHTSEASWGRRLGHPENGRGSRERHGGPSALSLGLQTGSSSGSGSKQLLANKQILEFQHQGTGKEDAMVKGLSGYSSRMSNRIRMPGCRHEGQCCPSPTSQ